MSGPHGPPPPPPSHHGPPMRSMNDMPGNMSAHPSMVPQPNMSRPTTKNGGPEYFDVRSRRSGRGSQGADEGILEYYTLAKKELRDNSRPTWKNITTKKFSAPQRDLRKQVKMFNKRKQSVISLRKMLPKRAIFAIDNLIEEKNEEEYPGQENDYEWTLVYLESDIRYERIRVGMFETQDVPVTNSIEIIIQKQDKPDMERQIMSVPAMKTNFGPQMGSSNPGMNPGARPSNGPPGVPPGASMNPPPGMRDGPGPKPPRNDQPDLGMQRGGPMSGGPPKAPGGKPDGKPGLPPGRPGQGTRPPTPVIVHDQGPRNAQGQRGQPLGRGSNGPGGQGLPGSRGRHLDGDSSSNSDSTESDEDYDSCSSSESSAPSPRGDYRNSSGYSRGGGHGAFIKPSRNPAMRQRDGQGPQHRQHHPDIAAGGYPPRSKGFGFEGEGARGFRGMGQMPIRRKSISTPYRSTLTAYGQSPFIQQGLGGFVSMEPQLGYPNGMPMGEAPVYVKPGSGLGMQYSGQFESAAQQMLMPNNMGAVASAPLRRSRTDGPYQTRYRPINYM
ncbi:MAG: hypothetical protein M1824_001021 [Vezdaea acicularis]|nr:MAG: hypothetical protein M1824_001021 [Vezdaea acicularis]